MRVSTLSMHQSATNSMLARQTALARTQNQLSTGLKLQSAADDPAAAVHVIELERALAAAKQHETNATHVKNRLQLEEVTIADATGVLQRVRELALRANSPVLDNSDRAMLTAEIRARLNELVAIANRQDVGGDYLFAGFAGNTQPFARAASGSLSYFGDSGERQQLIGPGQKVADGHSGDRVFMKVPEANGTFVTRHASANTGTGIVAVGTVTDRAAWVRDNYTVSFTSPGNYEVRDSASNLVTSGSYTSDSAIQFRGISFTITGAPATGDQFTVRPASNESIFATVDKLVALTATPVANDADKAKLGADLGAVLQQLTQGIDHVLGVRAEIGSRLSAIDVADEARSSFDVENQTLLSQLRDVDYAEAITRMNREMLALQAAQQSYTRLSQLSLFNYL